ncbi:MAG: hypothetical protein ABH834_00550 [Candidatus Altiarchaeota archaeon]
MRQNLHYQEKEEETLGCSRMSEKITFLALATSIVGLVILTFFLEGVVPPLSEVSVISQSDVGKTVHIQGIVGDVHVFNGGSAVLTVSEGDHSISVYLPYDVSQAVNASSLNGLGVDVVGSVNVYDGKLELVVEDDDSIKSLK